MNVYEKCITLFIIFVLFMGLIATVLLYIQKGDDDDKDQKLL